MGDLSPWHLLIVAVVFVLLFGAKKLPDAARSLGQSLRIVKAETSGLRGDSEARARTETTTTTRTLPPAPTAPAGSVEPVPLVTERPDPR
ncbi:MAG: Sec-independent protein translocase subunit TatA [Mycobacteriales bacterium]